MNKINNVDEYRQVYQKWLEHQSEINSLESRLVLLRVESQNLEQQITDYKRSKLK
ncbi:hypothetical protein [Microcoleus sp. B4-C1]|uniref:hypothetical protein n=1 Tax=Microcoleus sp. B4-C1 TaxID=2818660 RepID=UPI002FD017FD